MNLKTFKQTLQSTPKSINFTDTITIIEELYQFTPAAFTNGTLYNNANQNNGSCKVFAFALKQQLTKEETLACFGQYYFEDVLQNPTGNDHQNIRNFINTGFEGLRFEKEPLIRKNN
ncbi:HopJ type III effector protein [Tenacibaculum sp. 190524A02b]|uniref:HopJ type III effector protein n=1 Tax=Tenacibaculum vairaonense TaxID=3137860 RepID=A0ABM9PMY0_9FLAO